MSVGEGTARAHDDWVRTRPTSGQRARGPVFETAQGTCQPVTAEHRPALYTDRIGAAARRRGASAIAPCQLPLERGDVRQQLSVLGSGRRQAARDEGDGCNQASDDQGTQTRPSGSQALLQWTFLRISTRVVSVGLRRGPSASRACRTVVGLAARGLIRGLGSGVNRLSAGGRKSVARPLTPAARPSGGS